MQYQLKLKKYKNYIENLKAFKRSAKNLKNKKDLQNAIKKIKRYKANSVKTELIYHKTLSKLFQDILTQIFKSPPIHIEIDQTPQKIFIRLYSLLSYITEHLLKINKTYYLKIKKPLITQDVLNNHIQKTKKSYGLSFSKLCQTEASLKILFEKLSQHDRIYFIQTLTNIEKNSFYALLEEISKKAKKTPEFYKKIYIPIF